jgi:predicted RecB family nuclease
MLSFDEYRAYFRLVRRKYEAELQRSLPSSVDTATPYPDPVAHCEICNWYPVCADRWTRDDYVALVAGIQRSQRKELKTWGVTTLAGLAHIPLPLQHKPSRGNVATFERLREQARLQLETRSTGQPQYEILQIENGHGLAALPSPSPLDVFLDLEGDRQAEHGGFDYLFGYAFRDADGPQYEALWALSANEEKIAFEMLIDKIIDRRVRDPSMHVYHYAPYEVTALKRLMGRYGTKADELDQLLRAKVFVDLYGLVRKGLRAGIDSYSIKKLEIFYGLTRKVDLHLASRHLRAVEYAIARGDVAAVTPDIREAVLTYNRDDCLSALALRDWLEAIRKQEEQRLGIPIPRPTAPLSTPEKKLGDRLARIRAVSEALTAHLPVERSRDQAAQWILAQILEWHRREDKIDWWEYFRLNAMTEDELIDERAGIAGLVFERRLETTKRGVVIDRYRFPPQDTDLDERDDVFEPGSERPNPIAEVETIDLDHTTIDLRKGVACADYHPKALFKQDKVGNPDAVDALLRLGEFVRDHGIDSPGSFRPERDLLLHLSPRLLSGNELRKPGESTVACARRVVLALDGGVLPIQGPPGSGKTFTGANIITDLVRAGKRIGITANSHKVIRNLLDEVVKVAAKENVRVRCMHRAPSKSKTASTAIFEETNPSKAVTSVVNGNYDVVGGTAWLWAKQEVTRTIDVLVIDEAGQMSLANVLACAQSAKNVVLLGDPQQLEQPQKAAHPEGSDLSALEYLLEGHDTIPDDRGLFLGETWRLHPSICSYTSDLFYEGKLSPHPTLAVQAISGRTQFEGAGLFYVPVEHEGNQNSSSEEAERVAEIVAGLVIPGVNWINRFGQIKPLRLNDILIVAPYNAQVSEISRLITGARVGTVDKFQGQEAPIVIYSIATSSPDEAPHGMEFLFSRHRLNVAVSRARCVSILVAAPRIFEPTCRTPDQMRMANAFCAYLERAVVTQRQP